MNRIRYTAALLTVCLFAFSLSTLAEPARPKVGLVLGGGGALGLAHIGVLKVLEEQRIPIDFIAGTSMGSIIAAYYACGMSPDEMQTFLEGLDWNEVMSDETPRRELFFRRKQDDQRYLFEMGMTWGKPKVGTGMAAGQKFNNIMQFITLRAMAVTNFDDLPIPFRAVATDLQSGEPFVMGHGNLAKAMRASMAVPGVFTAVEMDGHVLVDGGVVNNLPVDIVKAMGADIIIAVDVGADADKADPMTFKSLGGILSRTYTIAQRPGQVEQFKKADIGIQPVLAGLSASEFHRVSEFVPQGMAAAQAQIAKLSTLSVSEAEYKSFLAKQRRANPQSLPITEVLVTGNQRVNEKIIRGRIRAKPDTLFDPRQVQRDLLRVYGLGEFEQVLFRVEPRGEGAAALNYDVKEKETGPTYFKYGLQLRSDFEKDAKWSMLLNLTRMSINALGAEWRNEVQIGNAQKIQSEFYQPMDYRGLFFLAPHLEYRSEIENVYQEGRRIAEYDVSRLEGRFDLGVQLRHFAELRVGPLWGKGKAEVETGTSDLPEFDEKYAGWRAGFILDRLDRTLFAREGYYVEVAGLIAREAMGGERDFDKIAGAWRQYMSLGDHTLTLGLQGGTSLGSDLPGYAQFTLGGPFSFAGLAEDQFRGSYLGVGSLGYRYRLLTLPSAIGRGVYALVRFDAGNVWPDGVDMKDLRYGGALGLGADTKLGPLYLAYGHADEGYDAWYFSLGAVF